MIIHLEHKTFEVPMHTLLVLVGQSQCSYHTNFLWIFCGFNIPYVGKFWSGKILANGRPFAKIFPANIFKTPNRIPEQNYNNGAGLLKYFKPKQRYKDNDNEVKPKGLPDPNGDLSKVVPVFFHRSY